MLSNVVYTATGKTCDSYTTRLLGWMVTSGMRIPNGIPAKMTMRKKKTMKSKVKHQFSDSQNQSGGSNASGGMGKCPTHGQAGMSTPHSHTAMPKANREGKLLD